MNFKQNEDLFELFYDHYQEEMLKMSPVQILVTGKTGVGKSTLINAMFREPVADVGSGFPVTQAIRKYENPDLPLILYDTRGFELDPESQSSIRDEILDLLRDKARARDPEDRLHLIWYCVNSLGQRLEPYEVKLLEELGREAPVLLVLTQTLQTSSEFEKNLRAMKLPVKGIVAVLARDYELGDHTVQAHSLDHLVLESLKTLPSTVQGAFINAQTKE